MRRRARIVAAVAAAVVVAVVAGAWAWWDAQHFAPELCTATATGAPPAAADTTLTVVYGYSDYEELASRRITETDDTVIVEVTFRDELFVLLPPHSFTEYWTVELDAPLGDRSIVDVDGNEIEWADWIDLDEHSG